MTGLSLRNGAKDEAFRRPAIRREKERCDRGVLITFILLLAVGLLTLYAASYYNAQDRDGNPLAEVASQLAGIALGAAGMAVILRVDYRLLQKPAVSGGLLGLSLLLLALVAVPGVGKMLNGSRRWLKLGPVSFQPSELAKYAAIVHMARMLSQPRRDLSRLFTGLLPVFLMPVIMFALILLQPNLSTAGSIVIVSGCMALLAGARWLHLGLAGCAGLAAGAFYAWSEPYRRARLMSFRDPFAMLSNEGYQLAQSLMAFGSGGLFGMGLGRGRQKYAFLPYPESDFIFAVVGEDLGLAGCLGVLALFMLFVFFGLRAAMRCPDRFGSLLAGGITCMVGVQTVMNMAVVMGMMPTTGQPLPFFSAGGTSIAVLMCAVGVLLNISRSRVG
ncbi:MAG: putative lipid II flippase FtsW [Clostridia bacterium]|nr:putative lipid II flippase FtsW [Clostridia bacterium]